MLTFSFIVSFAVDEDFEQTLTNDIIVFDQSKNVVLIAAIVATYLTL